MKTFLISLVFSLVVSGFAGAADWPVLKTYEGECLRRVKMPIGGIGTGTVSLNGTNAYVAADAAFSYGDEWRLQLLDYLQGNVEFTEQYLKEHLPQIKMMRPQASFLLWLDFRELGMEHKDLVDFLLHKAKVGFNSGLDFGPEGEGFMRMNIGTPRANIEEALRRIHDAL